MEEWMDEEWMEGYIDGGRDGWIHGWMDRGMDGGIH